MRVESVSCNNCGAPLQITSGTNFVTCGHCRSRLAIKRTATTVHTELMEKIDRRTEVMARQLAQITYQNELERIDREWKTERQGFLSTDKQGNKREPTTTGALLGGVILIAFGLLIAVSTGGMGVPFIFPLFGLGFAGFGVYLLIAGLDRARRYEQAHESYRRRRAAVSPDQFLSSDEEPPAASR